MSFDRSQTPIGEQIPPNPSTIRGFLHRLVPWRKSGFQKTSPQDTLPALRAAEAAQARPRNRQGEDPRAWFRCDRIFFQNGGWYIATREGIDVGPYANAAAARRDEKHLIKLLTRSAGNGLNDQALIIRQFINRPRHDH